jgi:CMP-N-acetylneuraminic acid synthetase
MTLFSDNRPVLALIPARGGSKGIRRKNLALVGGRPLVWHTLNAALHAPVIDAVWLSSDDEEILQVGQDAGAKTLRRPAELASDAASAVGVVQHFAASLPETLSALDPVVVYLQPTSPLRTAKHIVEALALMQREGARSVMSVVELQHSPYKSFKIDQQGRLQSLFDESLSNARRQDLPATFLPNGAIYAFTLSEFAARGGFPSNGGLPYVMTESESLDIDTPADLKQLELQLGDSHA